MTLQIILRKDFAFASPLLETPSDWIVHGFDEDLDVAMRAASLEMLSLLTDLKGVSRNDAYSLMSVAADFAVTQVVDGRQGVHARISRAIFPSQPYWDPEIDSLLEEQRLLDKRSSKTP